MLAVGFFSFDSLFGAGWARLGIDAALAYVTYRDSTEGAAAARYSLRALATAPDLAQSHLARGLYHRSVTLQVDSAITYLTDARELSPGDADVAHFLASAYQVAGRLDEALTEARRGAALDPKNPSALGRVARVHAWSRRLDDAWESHLRVRALAPAVVPPFSWNDGPIIRLGQGDLAAARAAVASVPSPDQRSQAIVYNFTPYLMPQVVDDSLLADTCERGQRSLFAAAPWSRHLLCAEAARRVQRASRMRAHADSAAELLRGAVPGTPAHRTQYAWALLLAGDTVEALRHADLARAWRRMDEDAYFGTLNTIWYVQIVALAGDVDRTVPALRELLTKPSPVTAAWLRADPTFDRLRDNAQFVELLTRAEAR